MHKHNFQVQWKTAPKNTAQMLFMCRTCSKLVILPRVLVRSMVMCKIDWTASPYARHMVKLIHDS